MSESTFAPDRTTLKYRKDEFGIQYDDSYYEENYISIDELMIEISNEIRRSLDARMPDIHIHRLLQLFDVCKESKAEKVKRRFCFRS